MALAFVGMLLWNQWTAEHAPKPQSAATESSQIGSAQAQDLPPASAFGTQKIGTAAHAPSHTSDAKSRIVSVHTDVLDLKIDTKGGNIVSAGLPAYPKSLEEQNVPVQILNDDPSQEYIAQSGLMGELGPDTRNGQVVYQTSQREFKMTDGQESLNVDLTWRQGGVVVTKQFIFKRGQYSFGVNYNISNGSAKNWQGYFYAQIRQKHTASSSMLGMNTYQGPAISSAQHPYEKIKYKQMDKQNLDRSIKGGWVAMQQRYFVSAWVPDQQQLNHYFTQVNGDQLYTIGFVGPQLDVPAGDQRTIGATFYVGPEIEKNLAALAPNLGSTIDYGWAWWASEPIFWLLSKIYNIVGNWGWAIVLVTILIKLAFYKLSETSYRSMAKMKAMSPRLTQLKERFGDDKAKLQQATMELYKKEKINPLGGCLPMLVQIPFFFALYSVLLESVQLRHAPFMLWIHDLSAKDPYYILPILMGVSMFVQQLLNPPQMDKAQEMMMKFGLPVLFTVMFMNFPAGLVLYWFVNNVLSALQQEFVMRRYNLGNRKKKVNKVATSA